MTLTFKPPLETLTDEQIRGKIALRHYSDVKERIAQAELDRRAALRATQSNADLLKASQSHTSAIKWNTIVRIIAGVVAAPTLIVTLILKGREIWDWLYNLAH